jgi:hypothetical protein
VVEVPFIAPSPIQIQNRIAAVVQRITAKDVESADTRERFLASRTSGYSIHRRQDFCVEVNFLRGEFFISTPEAA